MTDRVRIILNAIWSSRIQLSMVLLIIGLLSVGQGKELSLSQQGTLKYSSMLAVFSAAVFALQLWYWTYISILVAPVSSHRFLIWSSDNDATRDARLTHSASYVAAAYSEIGRAHV